MIRVMLHPEDRIATVQCHVAPTHRAVCRPCYDRPPGAPVGAVFFEVECHDCDDDAKVIRDRRDKDWTAWRQAGLIGGLWERSCRTCGRMEGRTSPPGDKGDGDGE